MDRCSLFVDKILLLIGDFFVMEKKKFYLSFIVIGCVSKIFSTTELWIGL